MSKSSKSKVIVLTVLTGDLTIAEVAQRYEVSRRWVHILLARYRQGGLQALEPISKAPRSNSRCISDLVRKEIVRLRIELGAQGLDNGSRDDCLAFGTGAVGSARCLHHLAHPCPVRFGHTPTKEET